MVWNKNSDLSLSKEIDIDSELLESKGKKYNDIGLLI
jgi:hypothetical protein